MSEVYSQQQIGEEQENHQTKSQKNQQNVQQSNKQIKNQSQSLSNQQANQQEPLKRENSFSQKENVQTIHQSPIKHQQIGKYANVSMEIDQEKQSQIKLKIVGTDSKGSTFTKYTVYIIKGYDKDGEINVSRRFSEFHAMRTALCKRWPGCFIPSIPQKNFMNKNDKDQIIKRQRYLNDFLYKITKLPHLYASQQFQALIRSGTEDISSIFDSWSSPTYESIINKYRDYFNQLAGKQIDQSSNDIIAKFYASIVKNQSLIEKYRLHAKNLALAKDKYNRHFPLMFSRVIPGYERDLLNQYSNGNEDQLVYLNPNQAKICQNSSIISDICQKNPFWLLYDMLKHQERDGKAFMEIIKSRENLESKKHSMEVKIKQNEKAILDISEGKKNVKNMSSKSSNDQVKYKLEVETQQLKKQKTFLTNLLDIITALIIFVQIPSFKEQKIHFYQNVLRKIGGFQINTVQISGEVWETTSVVSKKINQIASK